MRFIFLIFLLFITSTPFAQNCKNINTLQTFHGIKFGDKIPEFFSKEGKFDENVFYVDRDTLDNRHKFDLLKCFSMASHSFETMAIECNKQGEVYSIEMWTRFDFIDSIEVARGDYPTKFNRVYKQLLDLFGKESREEKENEPVMNEIFGNKIKLVWDCLPIRMEYELTYGAKDRLMNNIAITIINMPLKNKAKLSEINN